MKKEEYTLEELSVLLKYQPAYIRMVIRKFIPFEEGEVISAGLAKSVAEKLKRPWPPEKP